MKTAAILIAGSLSAVALVGPGHAQTGTAPAAPAAPTAPATPAAKPAAAEPAKPAVAPPAKPKQVGGEVVSVNADQKTLIVKVTVAGKPAELTFGTDKATGVALADLKPGDHIRVAYTDADGKRTATAITRAPEATKAPQATKAPAAKAPEAKAPEAKPKQ
jgi:hypothetical protein